MTKQRVLLLVTIIIAAGIYLFGGVFVAETNALGPGDPLFVLQDSAEQMRLRIKLGDVPRAQWSLELVDRRVANLAAADNPDAIREATQSLSEAFSRAANQLSDVPDEVREPLYKQLDAALVRADVAGSGLEAYPRTVQLCERMRDYRQGPVQHVLRSGLGDLVADAAIAPEPIPFLASGVVHDWFPHIGGHAPLVCADCHADGVYSGRPNECVSCHEQPVEHVVSAEQCESCHDYISAEWTPYQVSHAGFSGTCDSCHVDVAPIDHYPEAPCSVCHVDTMWDVVAFDHTGGQVCEACHADVTPVDHYPDSNTACSVCHRDVVQWEVAGYDHGYGGACESCHAAETPDAHYPGACNLCHVDDRMVSLNVALLADAGAGPDQQTSSSAIWQMITYDHSHAVECESCHALPELEAEAHYEGACHACHIDTDEWNTVWFDHTGYDECTTCHTEDAPQGHYAGQCSNCHHDADWANAWFNHNGFYACESCHSAETPAAHYGGACLDCHIATDWTTTVYQHQMNSNCTQCHASEVPTGHYAGSCTVCHSAESWQHTLFSHDRDGDCAACHTRPFGHYDGQCGDCHHTDRWGDAYHNHAGIYQCNSCHAASAPSGHYGGECANCHDGYPSPWTSGGFNHAGQGNNCAACHTAPAGHYPGQCSTCHASDGWDPGPLPHDGLDNCASCHGAPAQHSDGQCSICHTTDTWEPFDVHDGNENCQSCHARPASHYSGQCSDCHTIESWDAPDPHAGMTDCQSCHVAPAGHLPSQCSNCHHTTTWGDTFYNHQGPQDCKSCHNTPSGHPNGQCSNCHSTGSWNIADDSLSDDNSFSQPATYDDLADLFLP